MKEKKVMYPYFIVALFTVFIIGTMAYFYMDYLNKQIGEETMISMKEVSQKNASTIENRINDNLQLVDSLSEVVIYEDLSKPKEIIEKMKFLAEKNHLKRIGIADVTGDCYTTDDEHLNISQREYFQKALKGESNVSEVITDKIGAGDKINAYATPVMQNGKVKAVFFYVKTVEDFTQDILITSFSGQGHSILCDPSGKLILKCDDYDGFDGIDTMRDLSYSDKPTYFDEKQDSGFIKFTDVQKEACYLSFEAIDYNGWFVLTIVPASVVTSRITSFSKIAFLIWFIIIFVAVIFFLVFYHFRRRSQRQMEAALYDDPLTGHDNFNKFKSDVSTLLETSPKRDIFSIVEFDICEFKMFNKIYGYAFGDDLLITIMYAVNLHLRAGEHAARISEDRFVALLVENDEKNITRRISKIYAEIQNDYTRHHPGSKFAMQFGVYQMHMYDYDLMKCLDKAIYAKNNKKNDPKAFISFYSEEMYQDIVRKKQIESRMQSAMDHGEFVVYFQPKVDIESNKVVAAEALVRWKDPQNGLVSPGEFIPIFEKNGFLEILDMYVIDTVLSYMASWRGKYAPISVSVNLSKTYIFQEGFSQRIYDMTQKHGIDPKYLELEITESTMLDNSERLIALIKELKSFGFLISMDDFGSGYSSLNMLKEIPIDIIKLDQVFLRSNEQTREKSKLIVEGIMDMINLLGIDTVAEGVETKDQLQLLYDVHCRIAQGFYFYKPMPISEFEKLL